MNKQELREYQDHPLMIANCRIEGCTRKRHGPRFEYCTDHLAERYDKWKKQRKQILVDLGLLRPGLCHADVVKACKELGSIPDGTFSLAKTIASLRTCSTKPLGLQPATTLPGEDGGEDDRD